MKTEKNANCLFWIQVLFVFTWLANLVHTDSRYSVYALLGVLALLCIGDYRKKEVHTDRKAMVWIDIFSILFSGAVILANYPCFEPVSMIALVDGGCTLLGGFFVARSILLFAFEKLPFDGASISGKSFFTPGFVFAFAFLFIAAIDLLYLIFVAYPGILTRDSFSTVKQIMGDSDYNNTMPFWHTITVQLFFRLGMALFSDVNAAVAVFHAAQILFMAACFSYAAVTLYQAGVPVPLVAMVVAVYGCIPYNIVYSVTLWKDVVFSGAALLFLTGLYRVLKQIGNKPVLNYAAMIAGAVGFSLWRTNGWFAFLAIVVIMFLLLRKQQKKLIAILFAILVLCWMLINPFLSWLGVSETDLVEAFAVPMQQVARVVHEERELTSEEYQLLSNIFDMEKLAERYDPQTVDPVKFEAFRKETKGYISGNMGQYLRLYVSLGIRYPGDYLKAWIEETKGYWNGGYEFWVYTLDMDGDAYGIAQRGSNNMVARLFASAFRLLNEPEAMKIFSSVGLYVWILIGCFLINVLKKRDVFLLTIPLLVLVIGLWLGTPVFCEFRYAYPVIISLPLIVCLTFFEKAE